MRERRWTIRLSEEEQRMLEELTRWGNFEKPSEWFRYVLRREYEKYKRERDEKGKHR